LATLCLIGCALGPVLAAGCAMNDGVTRVVEVSPKEFTRVVLQSQQPVLVNFYKAG
jgi:thioredoxin-like negative regulator of GroEL